MRLWDEIPRGGARMAAGRGEGASPAAGEVRAVSAARVPALPVVSLPQTPAAGSFSVPAAGFLRVWTPERIATLQRLRRSMTRREAASVLGCSEKAVSRAIERYALGQGPTKRKIYRDA